MRWIVGFGLQREHSGPAALARWLGDDASIIAVHVIDDARASFAGHKVREQLEQGARRALGDALARANLPADTQSVVTWGGKPEAVLGELAEQHNADGILIARHASHGDATLVHLGRTARRLLRRLPTPVIVVPPDLSEEGIGRGPVLLAGDAQHDAAAAQTFAGNLGAASGRTVELVHVYPERFKPAVAGAPPAYLAGMYERYREQRHEALERWMSAYNIGGLKRHETEGPVLQRIIDVARDHNACMVVCASRQLTTPERFFTSSTGSHLAWLAPFPVAVVPGGA